MQGTQSVSLVFFILSSKEDDHGEAKQDGGALEVSLTLMAILVNAGMLFYILYIFSRKFVEKKLLSRKLVRAVADAKAAAVESSQVEGTYAAVMNYDAAHSAAVSNNAETPLSGPSPRYGRNKVLPTVEALEEDEVKSHVDADPHVDSTIRAKARPVTNTEASDRHGDHSAAEPSAAQEEKRHTESSAEQRTHGLHGGHSAAAVVTKEGVGQHEAGGGEGDEDKAEDTSSEAKQEHTVGSGADGKLRKKESAPGDTKKRRGNRKKGRHRHGHRHGHKTKGGRSHHHVKRRHKAKEDPNVSTNSGSD